MTYLLQLETEARQYGDMLVGEFLQEPRHNTLRTLLGLTWGLLHCSTAALGRMLQLTLSHSYCPQSPRPMTSGWTCPPSCTYSPPPGTATPPSSAQWSAGLTNT